MKRSIVASTKGIADQLYYGMLWLRKVAINDSSDDNSGGDIIMIMVMI